MGHTFYWIHEAYEKSLSSPSVAFWLLNDVTNPISDIAEMKLAIETRGKDQRRYMLNTDSATKFQLLFQEHHHSIFIPATDRVYHRIWYQGTKALTSVECPPAYVPDFGASSSGIGSP